MNIYSVPVDIRVFDLGFEAAIVAYFFTVAIECGGLCFYLMDRFVKVKTILVLFVM